MNKGDEVEFKSCEGDVKKGIYKNKWEADVGVDSELIEVVCNGKLHFLVQEGEEFKEVK